MIYLEFIERDRWMPVEVFHHLGNQDSSWVEGAVDRMVLQLGRSFRLGPRPSYLCFWDIPDIGRLDAWEAYFHSAAAHQNRRSQAMHRAIAIERAGLYDALHAETGAAAPMYVVEYCQPSAAGDEEIRAAFIARRARHRDLQLLFVLRRLGRLGPDPALLAVWGAPSYAAAEPLIRTAPEGNVQLVDIGIYRKFGEETL